MEKERLEDAISFGIHLVATRFGYRSLKPLQVSAIKAFISDSSWKGCFYIPSYGIWKIILLLQSSLAIRFPWLFDFIQEKQSPYHFVIVVSTLIALMKDQIKRLCENRP